MTTSSIPTKNGAKWQATSAADFHSSSDDFKGLVVGQKSQGRGFTGVNNVKRKKMVLFSFFVFSFRLTFTLDKVHLLTPQNFDSLFLPFQSSFLISHQSTIYSSIKQISIYTFNYLNHNVPNHIFFLNFQIK